MITIRRLLYAGGALFFAATLGHCGNDTSTTPDGGADMRPTTGSTPTLSQISPANAINTGGTLVTLTGTNFRAGATVTIGGVAATQVNVISSTQITCVVPAKAATCGAADVIVKNSDNTAVTATNLFQYASNGIGFAQASSVSVGTTPRYVLAVDINNDGKLDLLTANSGTGNVSIRTGNGDGTFSGTTNIDVGGGSPWVVAAVDLNKDQNLDLVTMHRQANVVRVRLGTGPGTFATTGAEVSVGAAPYDLAVGDLDKDGYSDVVTTNNQSNTVSILINDKAGSFKTATTSALLTNSNSPQAIILAQFNGDQNLDYVTVGTALGTSGTSYLTARLGDGLGAFGTAAQGLTNLNQPFDLVSGDFNGDGKLDLAIANKAEATVRVGVGVGDGSFISTSSAAVGTTVVSERAIASGDFNADGKLDLAVANRSDHNVSILLGNGDTTFAAKQDFDTGTDPTSVAIADLNKDGLADLMTTDQTANTVIVRLGQCK